jgi:hypothetical protein
MRSFPIRLAATFLAALAWAGAAGAQTADEVIEKSLAALGGRAAHAKIKSRSTVGTIVLSTPGGEISGTIEVLNAVPNKTRTLIKADLSSLGAGALVMDQRFDGSSGFVLDSLQGNREMTGGQLESMRNNSFPHPFLDYKQKGTSAQLKGKEKVGDREAFLLIFDPISGPEVRQYVDAANFLPLRAVISIDVPELRQSVEQTAEFLDYKELDGVKLPYRIRASSSIQNFTVTISRMEHNVAVDQTLFVKPAK